MAPGTRNVRELGTHSQAQVARPDRDPMCDVFEASCDVLQTYREIEFFSGRARYSVL